MPQRHPKNNHDLQQPFFSFDERRKLGGCHGSAQRERLFNACSICLQPVIAPLSCNKGHLFCKECIFECLLAQKKNIKRKLASFTNREKSPDKDEELKQRDLDAFDASQDVDRHILNTSSSSSSSSTSSIQRVSSYEEEALRTMKAFWLPSTDVTVDLQHQQHAVIQAPSFDTFCPEGHEKLKLMDLFQIAFTTDDQDRVVCPSCSVTLTGAPVALAAISTCGHVLCKRCADQVVNECLACHKPCKAKNLVVLGDQVDSLDHASRIWKPPPLSNV